MANALDEVTGPVRSEGRDINVIDKQLPITTGAGSVIFEIILWLLGIIPGLIFLLVKQSKKNYLAQLEQAIQHDASQIDNYLEQRVVILKNASQLLGKSIKLDKEILKSFANARGATSLNQKGAACDKLQKLVNATFEQYPNIKAHAAIEDCMQQNSYLQREITAAREQYNDRVYEWNRAINAWPATKIVAAKAGYTTRIPFSTDAGTKQAARGTFFDAE